MTLFFSEYISNDVEAELLKRQHQHIFTITLHGNSRHNSIFQLLYKFLLYMNEYMNTYMLKHVQYFPVFRTIHSPFSLNSAHMPGVTENLLHICIKFLIESCEKNQVIQCFPELARVITTSDNFYVPKLFPIPLSD